MLVGLEEVASFHAHTIASIRPHEAHDRNAVLSFAS